MATRLDLAKWISLAAAPCFAVMAGLSATGGDQVCMSAPHASPLNGMAVMYLLMSLFHLTPWLRLGSGSRWFHQTLQEERK